MRVRKIHLLSIPYFFSLVVLLISHPSHAAFINFDDIERLPYTEESHWADQPITDEYLSKGLQVDMGYLNSYYSSEDDFFVSGPNYLQGGPYFGLRFVGGLPKYVSMFIGSSHEDVVFLKAFCGDGSIISQETPGWAGENHASPFSPKQFVTFSSASGISHIDISAYYFLRTSAMVDDLTFHYSLPEPSAFFLFILGLIAMGWKRFAFYSTKK